MTSKMLQRARDFEKKYLPYTREELPKFHVTGGIGWINDPNGFAPYKGEYHLFFQYYPYDTKWGPMHWVWKASIMPLRRRMLRTPVYISRCRPSGSSMAPPEKQPSRS